jgi:hypothetical protein
VCGQNGFRLDLHQPARIDEGGDDDGGVRGPDVGEGLACARPKASKSAAGVR